MALTSFRQPHRMSLEERRPIAMIFGTKLNLFGIKLSIPVLHLWLKAKQIEAEDISLILRSLWH